MLSVRKLSGFVLNSNRNNYAHPVIGIQLAGGDDVTLQDAQYVRTRLETMANANVHGAYDPTMTTDPHLVSKAIFDWWWHHRGNKRRIPPYVPRPASGGTPGAGPGHRRGVSHTAVPAAGDRGLQLPGWWQVGFDTRRVLLRDRGWLKILRSTCACITSTMFAAADLRNTLFFQNLPEHFAAICLELTLLPLTTRNGRA